jgi:hypothetical protein
MDCFAPLAMTRKQPGSTGGLAAPAIRFFCPEPFPLRPKTLYGARSLRAWRNQFMINIKGLASGLRLWRVV